MCIINWLSIYWTASKLSWKPDSISYYVDSNVVCDCVCLCFGLWEEFKKSRRSRAEYPLPWVLDMKMFRREVVRREGFSLRPAALFAAASATIPSTSGAVVPGASVAITPSPSPLPLPPFFRFVCHAPLLLPPPTPVLLSLFSVWLGLVCLGRREYNVCRG